MKPENLQISRNQQGIVKIQSTNEIDFYYAMGYCHARDRGLQMLMMRLIGQGRLSEMLDSSEASLKIDIFFRRLNAKKVTIDRSQIPEPVLSNIDSYLLGIKDGFDESLPFELTVLGYRHEHWQLTDSILLSRMMGYIGLAVSQEEIETLFIEMVQAGIEPTKLEELFPGLLQHADYPLIQQIKPGHRLVPQELWQVLGNGFMASNNWVVAGSKTRSGKPILANDPHLEVNRLPNVWYELIAEWPDTYVMGATVPGLPGVIIGRTGHLSWGVTYTFMDAVDSWIEKCKDGKYFHEKRGWLDFEQREEVILRKKKAAHTEIIYENQHGILRGDPTSEGYYLTTRWASAESGLTTLIESQKILMAKNVKEGMEILGKFETAWNFVFCDNEGNIGYQMSGLSPKRTNGWRGFVPMPGWVAENDWQGFEKPQDLPHCFNPKNGYLATANNDLNHLANCSPITMPMASYRSDRINELLEQGHDFTTQDMQTMQYDLYSCQAKLFLDILLPLISQHSSEHVKILRNWDLCYSAQSRGAYLFEQFYQTLNQLVFAEGGLGQAVFQHLHQGTGIFIDFYGNFDRILLATESLWFGGKSQQEIYLQAWQQVEQQDIHSYGQDRPLVFQNILLGGKLPQWLGFDRGPYRMPGGRATIFQGQIYRSGGRTTSFFPTVHFITDMSEAAVHTNLAGGASDRRFSRWYCNDLDNWLHGKYHLMSLQQPAEEKF